MNVDFFFHIVCLCGSEILDRNDIGFSFVVGKIYKNNKEINVNLSKFCYSCEGHIIILE